GEQVCNQRWRPCHPCRRRQSQTAGRYSRARSDARRILEGCAGKLTDLFTDKLPRSSWPPLTPETGRLVRRENAIDARFPVTLEKVGFPSPIRRLNGVVLNDPFGATCDGHASKAERPQFLSKPTFAGASNSDADAP